ncbi:hypothetical protein INR49_029233 [Caranx melampygus]|nr:hypothetical protein INR49_029233 [Caranx melampygus]
MEACQTWRHHNAHTLRREIMREKEREREVKCEATTKGCFMFSHGASINMLLPKLFSVMMSTLMVSTCLHHTIQDISKPIYYLKYLMFL